MKRPIMNKIMLALLFVLTGTTGVLYYVLLKVDAAHFPINPSSVPEVVDRTYRHREPVILVSYGDGASIFLKNQNALIQSAINKGFDIMATYHRGHLDLEFYERNKAILEQPRGAGYWLWKPYMILKTLKMYPDNTVVVYADSGVVFSKPLAPLLKMLDEAPLIFVTHEKPISVRQHLTMEARNILGIKDNDPRLDVQKVWACFMVIKNTPQARSFVEEWLKLCEIKELVTDERDDQAIQDGKFSYHLHDESLLSLVVASHPEETKIVTRKTLRETYGVANFHRHDEYLSPLFISAGLPQWVSTALFNNYVVQQIRKHLS